MATHGWTTLLAGMRTPRIYVDTSVFGGCFDPEFERASRRFFELVRSGRILAIVSEVVADELLDAPRRVRSILDELPPEVVETRIIDSETEALRDAYLASGVVPPRSTNDATHVAAATVARADAITSWKFRDIVRFDRMRGFQGVNHQRGYAQVMILSLQGVQFDDT